MNASSKQKISHNFSAGGRKALSWMPRPRPSTVLALIAVLANTACGRLPFVNATGKVEGQTIPIPGTCYSPGVVAPDVWAACHVERDPAGKPVSMTLGPGLVATPSEVGSGVGLANGTAGAVGSVLTGMGINRGNGNGGGGGGFIGTEFNVREDVRTNVGRSTNSGIYVTPLVGMPSGM